MPAGAPLPGSRARRKYGYVIECTGYRLDTDGAVSAVEARLVPDTKSGTPGADAVKVKGVITWVAAHDGVAAQVRLYDRLFTEPQPDAGGRDAKASLNRDSRRIVRAWLEPGLAGAAAGEHVQFERHGYYVADRLDHASGRPVYNRTVTLKDTWAR